MNVRSTVSAALDVVLPNTWSVELPPEPAFPAAVFEVETTPEAAWCAGGGYDQHAVHLVVMARDPDDLDRLMPLFALAFEGLGAIFMFEEESGDADYESDPSVYARFLIVRLRTPRY